VRHEFEGDRADELTESPSTRVEVIPQPRAAWPAVAQQWMAHDGAPHRGSPPRQVSVMFSQSIEIISKKMTDLEVRWDGRRRFPDR
jgi:hypothetical protein